MTQGERTAKINESALKLTLKQVEKDPQIVSAAKDFFGSAYDFEHMTVDEWVTLIDERDKPYTRIKPRMKFCRRALEFVEQAGGVVEESKRTLEVAWEQRFPAILVDAVKRTWFKDLQHVMSTFKDFFYDDDPEIGYSVYITQFVAILLVWFGFSIEEIVALKKSDLHFHNEGERRVLTLPRQGELVTIANPDVVKILEDYRKQDSYYQKYSNTRVRRHSLCATEYFLRNRVQKEGPLGVGNLKSSIANLHAVRNRPDDEVWFVPLNLRLNSKFVMAYQLVCLRFGANPLNGNVKPLYRDRIYEILTDTSTEKSFYHFIQYDAFIDWLRTYHPNLQEEIDEKFSNA